MVLSYLQTCFLHLKARVRSPWHCLFSALKKLSLFLTAVAAHIFWTTRSNQSKGTGELVWDLRASAPAVVDAGE